MAYRTEIERALDEIISEETGKKFQGIAVVHAKLRDSGSREISTATHLPFAPQGFGNFPRLDQAFCAQPEIFLFGCTSSGAPGRHRS
jgi:hypothetical protein